MKLLTLSAMLFSVCGAVASANPTDLQETAAQAVYQRFSCVEGLTEVTTTSEQTLIGENFETVYSTVFRAVAFSHPARFTVKAIVNEAAPEKITIVSIDSLYGDNICP